LFSEYRNLSPDVPLTFTISSVVSLIFAYLFWIQKLPVKSIDNTITWEQIFSSCLPMWLVTGVGQLINWSGQITLGLWSTNSDVAYFAAAQRTALLMVFVLMAINMVVAPKFAQYYKSGQHEELKKTAFLSLRLTSISSIPLLLAMIVFPEYILQIFGSGFTQGAIYLQILAVGQFVNALTGSVGYLLSMSGHEKDLRNSSLISGTVVVILCLLLVPKFEGVGAAIAVAIAIALQNLLALHWVNKRLGINMLLAWKFK
jgi:O-antigen/teichoic acid export membrane protein